MNEKVENYKKLAQLRAIIETNTYKKEFISQKFIESNAHIINHQIPYSRYFRLVKPDLIGCTPLHMALKKKEIGIFEKLLKFGADSTIKNRQEETVFYQAVREYLRGLDNWNWKKTLEVHFVDMLLSALVTSENVVNPTNNDGISHFHIACMLNHTKVVELFLNAGVSVDQAVNFNSSILPGYTPLHFAARYFCLETMEVLLKFGANVHLKDAKGMSSLHLLSDENMKLVDSSSSRSPNFSSFEYYDEFEVENISPKRNLKN